MNWIYLAGFYKNIRQQKMAYEILKQLVGHAEKKTCAGILTKEYYTHPGNWKSTRTCTGIIYLLLTLYYNHPHHLPVFQNYDATKNH